MKTDIKILNTFEELEKRYNYPIPCCDKVKINFWKEAQKELVFDENFFLQNAIINRVRYLERNIYSEDNFIKIASRKELFYWLEFKEKFKLNFSFHEETEEFFNSLK